MRIWKKVLELSSEASDSAVAVAGLQHTPQAGPGAGMEGDEPWATCLLSALKAVSRATNIHIRTLKNRRECFRLAEKQELKQQLKRRKLHTLKHFWSQAIWVNDGSVCERISQNLESCYTVNSAP